jgi:hypothetical protein
MNRAAVSSALGVLFLFGSGCSKKPTPDECEALLDRYLDLSMTPDPELSRMPPQQVESVVSTKKAERKSNRAYQQARTRCQAEVSRDELECAMKAPTANDWEACVNSK